MTRSEDLHEQPTAAEYKLARVSHGFSVREIAEYLGQPYRTVQEWEAGRYDPPASVMPLLRELEAVTDAAVDEIAQSTLASGEPFVLSAPFNLAASEGIYPSVTRPSVCPVDWWRLVIARAARRLSDARVVWVR